MIKYCLVDSDLDHGFVNCVGIRQWVQAFEGKLVGVDEVLAQSYDIVHVRITAKNLGLIAQLRTFLRKQGKAKLLLSLDIPLPMCEVEFGDGNYLKQTVELADFVFATEENTAHYLQAKCEIQVHILPYPADIAFIAGYAKPKRNNVLLVLCDPKSGIKCLMRAFGMPQIVSPIFFSIFSWLFRCKIEFLQTPDSQDQVSQYLEMLSKAEYVVLADTTMNNMRGAILSATLGVIVLGRSYYEPVLRCYPYTAYSSVKEALDLFLWLRYNPQARRYVSQNAQNKAQQYSLQDCKAQLLDLMGLQHPYADAVNEILDWNQELIYVSGAKYTKFTGDDVVVYCCERNAKPYLEWFLNHYRALGVTHFVFVDYGSVDGTLGILQKQKDVILYLAEPHCSAYEAELRQTLVTKHEDSHWCLHVKINELFEYPYSDKLSIKGFLNYLKIGGFGYVAAHTLDMSMKREPMEAENIQEEGFYYDLDNIIKPNFYKIQLPTTSIIAEAPSRNGHQRLIGVRQQYVNNQHSKLLLVKHPLVYSDHYGDTDKYNMVKIADVSCVLRACHLGESDASQATDRDVSLAEGKMVRFKHVNELIGQGLISVSKSYLNYLGSEVPQTRISAFERH